MICCLNVIKLDVRQYFTVMMDDLYDVVLHVSKGNVTSCFASALLSVSGRLCLGFGYCALQWSRLSSGLVLLV